jgi:GNAT superfamily N-acetyltransferase
MADMLVKLYNLPALEPVLAHQQAAGVTVRRALAAEKRLVADWIARMFDANWAGECEVAFARQPVSCFVAVEKGQVVGFACHDATYRNFFGPTGVNPTHRGRHIGEALLLACLHAMAAQGYAYGIIGGVGPVDFYARTVGAIEIPDSTPGIYAGQLGPI